MRMRWPNLARLWARRRSSRPVLLARVSLHDGVAIAPVEGGPVRAKVGEPFVVQCAYAFLKRSSAHGHQEILLESGIGDRRAPPALAAWEDVPTQPGMRDGRVVQSYDGLPPGRHRLWFRIHATLEERPWRGGASRTRTKVQEGEFIVEVE